MVLSPISIRDGVAAASTTPLVTTVLLGWVDTTAGATCNDDENTEEIQLKSEPDKLDKHQRTRTLKNS